MQKNIANIRKEYARHQLAIDAVDRDPFIQFENWLEEAIKAGVQEPNAMTLATADRSGKVSARIVLLRDSGPDGLIFYTNYQSRKGQELKTNPQAALVFFWPEMERQIRIEGRIETVDPQTSAEYFSHRPRKSQISAWASPQSKVLKDRKALEELFAEKEKVFHQKEIPLPPNWGGYRLIPECFEFWQGRRSRLHDRISYKKKNKAWDIQRLAP